MQNGVKFIQKLTPDFKNHMRNLDNFRQAVESPKSWNSIGYICLKTTFLQLKHYIQKIYLTLLSTTCVEIHRILISFLKPHVIYHDTTRPYYFSSNVKYFWKKYPIKVQILRFFTAEVKIHQISHVIFQTKSEFFFKFWITVQCNQR